MASQPAMHTRSRRHPRACVNCKRSKIKCDEAVPQCGTCRRRGVTCGGFTDSSERPLRWQQFEPLAKRKKRALDGCCGAMNDCAPAADCYRLPVLPCQLSRRLGVPEVGSAHERAALDTYFKRHSNELVMFRDAEFSREMNAYTLLMLQHDSKALRLPLVAIGDMYRRAGSGDCAVHMLAERGRILERIRLHLAHEFKLEVLTMMLAGLNATDLISSQLSAANVIIEDVIAITQRILERHAYCGGRLSTVGNYFVRAIARQDMVLALVNRRRVRIPTAIWCFDEAAAKPDRFMGYTVSLMPVLELLCELAADVKARTGKKQFALIDQASPFPCKKEEEDVEEKPANAFLPSVSETDPPSFHELHTSDTKPASSPPPALDDTDVLVLRAREIKRMICEWRPLGTCSSLVTCTQKLLVHARTYISGSLLYLHRLLSPAGTSLEADEAALHMARQILLHVQGPPEDLRTCLFPIFLAACELRSPSDRAVARHLMDEIYASRATSTALLTKRFVEQRVWAAMDGGEAWDWASLVDRYPRECIPI